MRTLLLLLLSSCSAEVYSVPEETEDTQECSQAFGDCAELYGEGYACCFRTGACVIDDPVDCSEEPLYEDIP